MQSFAVVALVVWLLEAEEERPLRAACLLCFFVLPDWTSSNGEQLSSMSIEFEAVLFFSDTSDCESKSVQSMFACKTSRAMLVVADHIKWHSFQHSVL